MIKVNDCYLKLQGGYLFAEIGRRVKAFKAARPDARVISLGIGDVSRPLAPACIDAMHKAVDEYRSSATFHGYGPEQGYDFLIRAIIDNDYAPRGVHLKESEVFVSDGAKSDLGNIGDILGVGNKVAVTDPVYPVYVDSNVMDGRSGVCSNGLWSDIEYLPCVEENGFVPKIPEGKEVDIIYLCYPNNPTGTVLGRDELAAWVEYARAHKSLIIYDSAYMAFIRDERIPHSIYEIEGADECAIEFRSFSKTAGFTGVRCGYTVVPEKVMAYTASGEAVPLNPIWNRRQCTKFNGASYISQRGAEAVFSEQGKLQSKEIIDYYIANASYLKGELEAMGYTVYGGENAPYLWVKTPDGYSSWEFFNYLLEKAYLVCTPGEGFGPSGEGFVRMTAFGTAESYREAVERLKNLNNV